MENSDVSNDNHKTLRKNRRSSGVVERPASSPAKRQKVSMAKQKRRSSMGRSDLDLCVLENFGCITIISSNTQAEENKRKSRTSLNRNIISKTLNNIELLRVNYSSCSKDIQEINEEIYKTKNTSKPPQKNRRVSQNSDENIIIGFLAENSPSSRTDGLLCTARTDVVRRLLKSKSEVLLHNITDSPQNNEDNSFICNNENLPRSSKVNKEKHNAVFAIRKSENRKQKYLYNLQTNEIDLNKSFLGKDEFVHCTSRKNTKNNVVTLNDMVPKSRAPITRSSSKAFTKELEQSLNTAFVAELLDDCESSEVTGKIDRRKKHRRLSGLFPRTLNDAFIGDFDDLDEENIQNNESVAATNISVEENYSKQDAYPDPLSENNSINTPPKTPIKSKLRKRKDKKFTEEDILMYYTDKSVKSKRRALETISENSLSQKMSVRKYKRYIDFSGSMSDVKKKKRHAKVVKYKLWENLNPVTMEYFVTKMLDIEIGY